ncbi:MAG: tripartite tricarboxylate transporter TctB family protein, partial [Gemmatimonadaceae bacterium]
VTLLLLMLTLRLGSSARLVPLVVVVPLTALLMYRLARDVFGRAGAAPNEGASAAETPASTRAELAMMAWLLVLPVLTSLVGFVVGPALFVLVWMLWRPRERPLYALTAALITGVAVWLIFERMLRVQFPAGVRSIVPLG